MIIYAMLFVGLMFYFISNMVSPRKTEITFKVVGVANSTNSSDLVQTHFECIKFCTVRDYRDSCYAQCANLGKEGCANK